MNAADLAAIWKGGGMNQDECGDSVLEELQAFLAEYEVKTNGHDVEKWASLVAEDASYWFTEGSYEGLHSIRAAVQRTFELIRDEVYTIKDVHWVSVARESACVRYRFEWVGYVDGERKEGRGRGTNVMAKRGGQWQMVHEHLSV